MISALKRVSDTVLCSITEVQLNHRRRPVKSLVKAVDRGRQTMHPRRDRPRSHASAMARRLTTVFQWLLIGIGLYVDLVSVPFIVSSYDRVRSTENRFNYVATRAGTNQSPGDHVDCIYKSFTSLWRLGVSMLRTNNESICDVIFA